MSVLGRRLKAGAALARTNLDPRERPDRLPRALAAMAPWGATTAALLAGAAARYPDRVAVHDDAGSVTYRELWRSARKTAAALTAEGVGPDVVVGLMCRNHRGFLEWLVALSATGADVVLLNTGFAAPQLADVVVHEGISFVIHDDEFAEVVTPCGAVCFGETAMEAFGTSGGRVRPRRTQGRVVILTSGTTGRPKGAARANDIGAIEGVGAVLERLPLRLGDTQVVAAPLFHAWGLSHLLLGLSRSSTIVLSRTFDTESTLGALSTHRARVLVVVPVMLARMLAVSNDVRLPELEVIASSGSAIGSKLVSDVLDRFGPVLYNLYGSTEVAVATIADPDDLGHAPSTAGRVALGVRVEILDPDGVSVPDGTVGRIFVGGAMRFDGYTDGARKEEIRGLLASGDLGYFDGGLLFVEGREDDMIVSGGENVFPIEVEELLSHHPGVADVAVVGCPDESFGQVLAAFVVRSGDGSLTRDEARAHVRDHLARHKVPKHVRFLDELPRNATGKILRRSLVESL